MSEIKVKLLADTQSLLRDAKAASDKIESSSTVVRVDADTNAFTDGIRHAIEEAQKLQAVIQVDGRNAQPQPVPLKGQTGSHGQGGSNDPNRQLLDVLRNSQTLNTKASAELKKVIEDLSRIINESNKRSRSSGGGGGGGGNEKNNDNSGLAWKNALMQYMNIKPTGENGSVRMQDLLGGLTGGQGGGLMSLLSAIPGVGMLTGLLSGAGAVKLAAQVVSKDAEINEGYREKATQTLSDTYDVFGAVGAYDPEAYGEEGYSKGAYITMRTAQQYGYDMEAALSASEAMMSKAGFTDTDSFNQDLDSVLAASRATGVDTTSMAALAGKATQLGYQENGDQSKVTNLLTREIEVSGMQGREDEVVDVLESILDELGAVSSTVSEEAVGNKLNLINALSANSGLSGERAKSAIDSIEDFTSSDDMSVMLAAGWGSEFTGKEGWLALREMQETDPTAFMERVIKGYAAHGMSEPDIAYMLDRKGIGSVSQTREVISAVLNGSPVAADMNDEYANRSQGQSYIDRNNQQFDTSVAPYVRWEQTQDIGDFNQGAQELTKYKDTWSEKNDASGTDMANDKWWRDRNMFGQWGNDLGTYDMDAGQNQMAEMDDAWRNAKSGRTASRTEPSVSPAVQPARAAAAIHPQERRSGAASQTQSAPASPGASEVRETEYKGREGWLALHEAYEQNPEAYRNRVADSLAARGMNGTDVAFALDRMDRNTYAETTASEPVLANPFSDNFWGNVQQNMSYMQQRLTGQAESPVHTPGGRQALAAANMMLNPLIGVAAVSAMAGGADTDQAQPEAPVKSAGFTNPLAALNPIAGVASWAGNMLRQDDAAPAQTEPKPLTLTEENFGMQPVAAVPFTPDFGQNVQNNLAYFWNSLTGKADPWQKPQETAITAGAMEHPFGLQVMPADPSSVANAHEAQAVAGSEAGPAQDFIDAITRNTDELKKNTQALGGGTGGGSYVTGAQQQAALTNNGMVDSLSNSLSIQSPMSRFKQEHPFLYNLASGVRTVTTGVGNFFGGIGQAISDGLDALTGGGSSEPETFSSADGQSTVTLPDGTTTTKKADGTTITTGNGSISATGSFTDEEDDEDEPTIHRSKTGFSDTSSAVPHAIGNDYVPYDGYQASLHKGEMVLRRDEAELFRQGRLDEIQLDIEDEPEEAAAGVQETSRQLLMDDVVTGPQAVEDLPDVQAGMDAAEASLHKGEMVLRRDEAELFRQDGSAEENSTIRLLAPIANEPARTLLSENLLQKTIHAQIQEKETDHRTETAGANLLDPHAIMRPIEPRHTSAHHGHTPYSPQSPLGAILSYMQESQHGNGKNHFPLPHGAGQSKLRPIRKELVSYANMPASSEAAAKEDIVPTALPRTGPFEQANTRASDWAQQFVLRSPVTPDGVQQGLFNALKADKRDLAEPHESASAESLDGRPKPKTAAQTILGAVTGPDTPIAQASVDSSDERVSRVQDADEARKLLHSLPDWSAGFLQNNLGRFLETPAPEQAAAPGSSDINVNLNISVTGTVEGMDPVMQRQMVDSIQAQIAGSGLRDMLANGITRRQNW